MYVVFEGVDCLGKSTQIELLKEVYKDAIFTVEPGGTRVGESLRDIILNKDISKKTELFLFLADRSEHSVRVLSQKDKMIISDRSFISGISYAMGLFDKEFLIELNKFAIDGLNPDKIVFFKGDKKLIEDRLAKKKLDNIEKRGARYFLDIQKNMEILLKDINSDILEIDSGKSVDEIHKMIKDFLDDKSN